MADSSRPWPEPAVGAGPPAAEDWTASLAPAERLLIELAIIAVAASWLGFYFITALPFLDLEAFRATIVLHAVTGIVLVPYLVSLVASRRLPGGSVLDLPLAALVAAYFGTTAASLDWRVSLEVALTALMAVGVFSILSDGRLLRRWQVETAFMLAILAAAFRALWIVGADYVEWLRLTDAVQGGLSLSNIFPPTVLKVHDVGDHANLLGGMLAMSLPFFLVTLFRPVNGALRGFAALGAIAIVLAGFLALARSAWLGAGAGLLTSGVLLVFATPGGQALVRRVWPRTFIRRWLVSTLVPAVLAGLAVAVLFALQSTNARPIWLYRASDAPRVDVMQAGAEMIRDHPLLGTGPSVYSLLYPEYSGLYPDHAFHSHNGFLQTAVDMGVPGVAAMFLLAGALSWLIVRGLRETEGDAQLSLIACAGAVVAFGVFSLFDAPNEFKGPLVALAAVGAIAVLSARERTRSARPAQPDTGWLRAGRTAQALARASVWVALSGLLITWGRLDIAHYYFSNGLAHANAQRWPEAVDQAERAVDLDPDFAIYRLQLGVVQGQAYLATKDTALLSRAIYELERGLALEPRSAIGHANLALLLAQAGGRARARDEAFAARRYANSDAAVVLAAATALEQAGWEEEAIEAYSHVLFLDPGLADSPFWFGSEFRQARFKDVLGRSALVFNPCLLLSLDTAGVPDGPLARDVALSFCRQQEAASANDMGGRVALAEALIEDGVLDEARSWLDQVVERQPDFGPGRSALGRWYAAQGELLKAREQWLRGGQLGEVDSLVLLGDSYPPGQVPPEVVDTLRAQRSTSASAVQFHLTGILYYRFKFFRGSPVVILLPGEWQEGVPGRYARAQDALARWTAGNPAP